MSARKIIPKPGRVCLAKDGTRVPLEGIDVDMSVPDLAVWATRLVDVHGDATFDEPAPVREAPVAEAPAVELAVEAVTPTVDLAAEAVTPAAEPAESEAKLDVKPERARSRKGGE